MTRKRATKRSRARLSFGKKLVFALAANVALLLLVELSLALIGVEPVLYDEDPYVGFSSNVPLFVEQEGPDGRTEMVTARNKRRWFNEQRFPREKPSGGYRIFSVGGSTTYGRPYEDVASFSGWLREFLPVADPSRKWEVVNAGGISYASYRVTVLMEELARYQPDLFVIYSGHNEFLERRTYPRMVEAPRIVTGLGAVMSRTRIYAAMRELLSLFLRPEGDSQEDKTVLGSEVDSLLEHSVGPREYTRDDAQRERAIAHFRFNLNRMIDIAASAGARVVLVTPASNLKDVSPFKSEHRDGLERSELERFRTLSARADKARAAGRLEEALTALEEAARIDDRYAELHYRRGVVLYELGRYREARRAFERAVDEDVCPLRALTSIQQIVREVAAQRDVPLVDLAAIMTELSENGVPGSEYFLDHVHLKVEGYRLLALRLIEVLEQVGVVHPVATWNREAIETVARRVESRIDREAQGVAMRNLAKVFAWAGKLEEAERMAAEANQILEQDAESFYTLGVSAAERGDIEGAIHNYTRALDIEPDMAMAHNNLAAALASRGEFDEAIRHFRETTRLRPDLARAHYNLAKALESKGELDPAIRHFRRALGLEPDFADASNKLGMALVARGKPGEAIDAFRRALELQPDFPEAANNLGMTLASQGNLGEAIGAFRKALELKPDFTAAHYFLGLALRSVGRLEEAIQHFRQAIDVDPDFPEAHYDLANALIASGRLLGAVEHLEEAARLKPEEPRFLNRVAWILATRADVDDRGRARSIRLAERAAELTRYRDPAVLDTLAASYASAGAFERAIRTAEQALELASTGDARKRADAIRKRLELYRKSEPYREAATTDRRSPGSR